MKNEIENQIEKIIKSFLPRTGKILCKYFRKVGVKYTKDHVHDVVTEADIETNKFILSAIKKNFPDHGIISEETGEYRPDSQYVWAIDPLDGSYNFSRGIPVFVSMLAIFKNKHLIMSAIYDPVHPELAFARKGLGATINGKKIRASRNKDIRTSVGAVSTVFRKEQMKFFDLIVKKTGMLRAMTMGSAGFNSMSTARGAWDWHVNYNPRIWDIAPGILLLEEAGHKVTNIHGKPWQFGDQGVIAAEKNLHRRLVELVRKSLVAP